MSVFRFKEFVIDQENCPMKINTDGVLLGAMADVLQSKEILDIGTGTGIIALMLAQRNLEAKVSALDIDINAYEKAAFNFENSIFHERLMALHVGFKEYFDLNPLKKYDFIVSNVGYKEQDIFGYIKELYDLIDERFKKYGLYIIKHIKVYLLKRKLQLILLV